MSEEFEYDYNARELDRQLEEVMDSHKPEETVETKEAEVVVPEPSVLDRLTAPTSREAVDVVTARAKEASAILREEMVRDRLREYQDRGPDMVDEFIKTAKESS